MDDNKHLILNSRFSLLSQAAEKGTTLFLLQSELCFLIPNLISTLLLVSYSDYSGRKVAIIPPLLGDTLYSLTYALVSRFSLSLNYLLVTAFISGLTGGPTTLIGGCFAYVADLCREGPERQKTVRMARMDMILGVLTGLASLCTGFYIEAVGFTWPFFTATIVHLVNLLYVLVVLKESLVLPNPSPSASEAPQLRRSQALTARLQGVYLLFATSKGRRNAVLLLMLAAFAFFRVIMIMLIFFTSSIIWCKCVRFVPLVAQNRIAKILIIFYDYY